MADILIKGMELPESCGMCDAQGLKNAVWHFGYGCSGDIDDFANCPPTKCPLIPLPEKYGRLIDADATLLEINKICDRHDAGIISDLTCLQQLLSAVRHAPTIIPAEEDK